MDKVKIYSEMLSLQTHLQFPYERHLFQNPLWTRATKVLDFGTGNGSYISELDRNFPGKNYLSVEIDEQMMLIAKGTLNKTNFTVSSNIDGIDNSAFDAALLRMVLMHVPDRLSLLKKISEILSSTATVIIFDADDDQLLFQPSPPLFIDALNNLRSKSRSRRIIDTLDHEMESIGFKCEYSDKITVNSSMTGVGEKLFKYMFRTAELGIGSPLPVELSNELVNWWVGDGYVQYGFFGSIYSRA